MSWRQVARFRPGRMPALFAALLPSLAFSAPPVEEPVAPAQHEAVAEGPLASGDCTFTASHPDPGEAWRRISRETERVALGAGPVGQGGPLVPRRRRTSFVDAELFAKMARDGVKPAAPASDAELVRRLYLDLTGQPPSADALKAYLADGSADKRDRLIAQLLASDAFVERFTLWLGDLVQNVRNNSNGVPLQSPGRNAYWTFLRDSIRAGKPYDQLVRELIAGTGDSFAMGPPNFWVRQIQGNGPIQDTYDNMATFTIEKFLGVQATCLSCHGGPGHTDALNLYLSTKSRSDFWKSAAFFARTQQQAVPDGNLRKYIVSDNGTGAYRLNTTSGNKTPRQPDSGQPNTVQPAFLLTGETPRAGETWRQAYGRMLTAHPQFARNAVNQVWKELFGLGIVEPDDSFDLMRLDPANPPIGTWPLQPTHPELLTRLADGFVASGHDLRWLVRTLVSSEAYQLSMRYDGAWSETYVPYFARRYPRRLMAEQLADSICVATGLPPNVTLSGANNTMAATIGTAGASQPVARAFGLPDPTEGGAWTNFLNMFGRGNRDTAPRTGDGATTQALSMLNDPLVWARTRATQSGSTVQRTLAATKDPKGVADALYLATLSRYPTATESTAAVDYLKGGDLNTRTEDLQLALLNTLEFLHY